MIEDVHRLALETIDKKKQAIIFLPSKSSAEKTAEEIAKKTSFFLPELEQEILAALSTPTTQCRRLSHCVKKGIAFHHSGLTSKQKDTIEESFKAGKIKIICATPTLAAGLSLPVFRVIIKSLKRYTGRWGMNWIPVLEYLQMAGRAGRPEYETYGEAIVIAKSDTEKEEIYDKYICGVPEEIYSKLAVEPVLRTYLLSLISSGIIRDQQTMTEFFRKTFWAQQYNDFARLEAIMDRMLSLLRTWNFVENNDQTQAKQDLFVSARNLKSPPKGKLQATIIGKRVSELYIDPLTADHLVHCLQNFNADKNTFSLLQMISSTLEMRPLLRVRTKENYSIQEELTKRAELLLLPEPSAFDIEYGEFMDSIKTALFFEAWIDEKEEDYLLETFDARPGEIRVKQETADWLLYASEELAQILQYREAVKEIKKLRIRIEHGVKEDVLPLLQLKGIGRVRARKLSLNGIKNLGDLKRMDSTTLSQILGQKVAADVKLQLGQEIKEVPKGTRKGQLSLEKF